MKEKLLIWEYFDDLIDYPKDIADNPLPFGTLYQYVSATFLNGFINYINPLYCFLLDRYTSPTENIKSKEAFMERGCNQLYVDYDGTKGDLLNKILKDDYEWYHTTLDIFQDDIIILGKLPNTDDGYIFFWFDMDVSDCFIGRFKTDDKVEEIYLTILNALEESQDKKTIFGYHELPKSFLTGWIKF